MRVLLAILFAFSIQAKADIRCPDRTHPRIDCRLQNNSGRVLFCQVDAHRSVMVTSFGANLIAGVEPVKDETEIVYARTDLTQIEIRYRPLPAGRVFASYEGMTRYNSRKFSALCDIDKTIQRFGSEPSPFPSPARSWN